jgi:tetratricopeptide (TPR) repeat protein
MPGIGGFGSINHMIITLRNNKNLLSRRTIYERNRGWFGSNRPFEYRRKEFQKAARDLDLLKASPEQLARIRETIIKQRRIHRLRVGFVLVIFSMLMGFALFGLYEFVRLEEGKFVRKSSEESFSRDSDRLQQYSFFISDGDKYLQIGEWHNAIFQYRKAAELYPEFYEVNYRLGVAYSKRCRIEEENCQEAQNQIQLLLDKYPDKKTDALKLRSYLNK